MLATVRYPVVQFHPVQHPVMAYGIVLHCSRSPRPKPAIHASSSEASAASRRSVGIPGDIPASAPRATHQAAKTVSA